MVVLALTLEPQYYYQIELYIYSSYEIIHLSLQAYYYILYYVNRFGPHSFDVCLSFYRMPSHDICVQPYYVWCQSYQQPHILKYKTNSEL